MYEFKTGGFEGPLELLLDLIDRRKLSINEVSLAGITDEYIAYIRALEKFKPEEVASFLVVASTLMLVKSRSLLPQLEISDEEEADIQELEHAWRCCVGFGIFRGTSRILPSAAIKCTPGKHIRSCQSSFIRRNNYLSMICLV